MENYSFLNNRSKIPIEERVTMSKLKSAEKYVKRHELRQPISVGNRYNISYNVSPKEFVLYGNGQVRGISSNKRLQKLVEKASRDLSSLVNSGFAVKLEDGTFAITPEGRNLDGSGDHKADSLTPGQKEYRKAKISRINLFTRMACGNVDYRDHPRIKK